MSEEQLYKLYRTMNKEELIRLVIENKKRADRNAKELNKTIKRSKKRDKELEIRNLIINDLKKWLEIHIDSYKFYENYEMADACEMFLETIKETERNIENENQ